MQLISDAKLKKLKDAFVVAKSKRASDEFICQALERVYDSQEAVDLVESRLGSETLGTYMHARGFKNYRGHGSRSFNTIRDLWLNMLINEHSSHDMYLLARYRDYLISVRDQGFSMGAMTIQWGFSLWCYDRISSEAYQWLFKARTNKMLWKHTQSKKCCPELKKFVLQEILEVTNILIQEPK